MTDQLRSESRNESAQDVLTLVLRLAVEPDDSHSPETRAVLARWKPALDAVLAGKTRAEAVACVVSEKPASIEPSHVDLIQQAIQEHLRGNMPAGVAVLVIHSLLNPTQPTEADVQWAKDKLATRNAAPQVPATARPGERLIPTTPDGAASPCPLLNDPSACETVPAADRCKECPSSTPSANTATGTDVLVNRHSAELQELKDRPVSFDRLVETVTLHYEEIVGRAHHLEALQSANTEQKFIPIGHVSSLNGCTGTLYEKSPPDGKSTLYIAAPDRTKA